MRISRSSLRHHMILLIIIIPSSPWTWKISLISRRSIVDNIYFYLSNFTVLSCLRLAAARHGGCFLFAPRCLRRWLRRQGEVKGGKHAVDVKCNYDVNVLSMSLLYRKSVWVNFFLKGLRYTCGNAFLFSNQISVESRPPRRRRLGACRERPRSHWPRDFSISPPWRFLFGSSWPSPSSYLVYFADARGWTLNNSV